MRLLGAIQTSFLNRQAGFNLIEVLISVVLLSVIGVVVIRAIDTSARGGKLIDEQITATNLATQYLEVIRDRPYDTSDPPYSNVKDSIPPPSSFDVTIDAEYSNDGTSWTSTYSSQKLQKVIITVSQESGKVVRSFCSFKVDFPGVE